LQSNNAFSIHSVLKERKLCDEKDHRIFRPDTQMRKVFGLSDSVMTSTSHKDTNGFNFMTLQKHISRCLKQHSSGNELKQHSSGNETATETSIQQVVAATPVKTVANKKVKQVNASASA
jgi:chromatin remodeling complex protein RSC6